MADTTGVLGVATGDSSATQVQPQPILRPVEELPTPQPTFRAEGGRLNISSADEDKGRYSTKLDAAKNRKFVESKMPKDPNPLLVGPHIDQVMSVRENTTPAVPEKPATIAKTVQPLYKNGKYPGKLVSPREKIPLEVPPRVPKESASLDKSPLGKDALPLEKESNIDTTALLDTVNSALSKIPPETMTAELASQNAELARETVELNNLKEASPSRWKAHAVKAALLGLIAAVAMVLKDDSATTPPAEQQFKNPNADVAAKIIQPLSEDELKSKVVPEAAVAPPEKTISTPIETELISHEVLKNQSISSILALYNPEKYLDPNGKFRYDDITQGVLYTNVAQVLNDNRAQLELKNPELYKLIDEATATNPIDGLRLKKLVQQTGGPKEAILLGIGDILNIKKTKTAENNSQPDGNESPNEQIVQPVYTPQPENRWTPTPPTTLHTPPPTPAS